MPSGEFDSPFVRGIEHNKDWALVFHNNKMKLLVDMTTPQAQALFQGIRTGDTVYPDEFSKNLILAHHLLSPNKTAEEHKEGLECVKEAFDSYPSQAPMLRMLSSAGYPELGADVVRYAERYFKGFVEQKKSLARQDGYYHRIVAAMNAATYLREIAKRRGDTKGIAFYNSKLREYSEEQKELVLSKRW
jgi:hypothetical protein